MTDAQDKNFQFRAPLSLELGTYQEHATPCVHNSACY